MKTNGTRFLLIVLFLQLLLLVFAFCTKAQSNCYFNSSALSSGTSKQIGTVYRYDYVKPGVGTRVVAVAYPESLKTFTQKIKQSDNRTIKQ